MFLLLFLFKNVLGENVKFDKSDKILLVQIDNRGIKDLPNNAFSSEQNLFTRRAEYIYDQGFWVHGTILAKQYADIHGMDYLRIIPETTEERKKYHHSWWRTWILQRILRTRQPDWIFFFDCDAFVEQMDLHVFDFLNSQGIEPNTFVAGFYSHNGAGAGEFLIRNDENSIGFLKQWEMSIENGWCPPKFRFEISLEQTCLRKVFFHNRTNHEIASKGPINLFTKRFIRHCGGEVKLLCVKRNVYMNMLRRLEITNSDVYRIWNEIDKKYI